jgi:DNA replication protein DnaC
MMKSHDLHALHEALGVLKLDQIALSLDALCQQAAKEEWTYSTFLARLLDEELSAREQRRLSVTTKMAHFPFHKTLEQFDFGFQPSVEKRRRQELASLRFVASGENVL